MSVSRSAHPIVLPPGPRASHGPAGPGLRNRLLALEPRLLFDAALVATGMEGVVAEPTPASDAGPVTVSLEKGAFGDSAARDASLAGRGGVLSDADVEGVDAGDTVHFAIRITNQGERAVFDLVLTDRLPPGFSPTDVHDLRLQDGNGQAIDWRSGEVLRNAATGAAIATDQAFAEALFGADGVEFVDPGHGFLGTAGKPVLKTFDHEHARSVVVLYSVDLPGAVVAGGDAVNKAVILGAASSEGGPNPFADGGGPCDSATVTIAGARLETALIATDQPHTVGADAVIGEVLTYQTRITLPEGQSPGAVLTQTLDPGLALVAIDRIEASAGIEFAPIDRAAIVPDAVDGGEANRFRIDFGTIDNRQRDNAVADVIVVTWRAVLTNVPANQQGESRLSTAGWRSTGGVPVSAAAGSATGAATGAAAGTSITLATIPPVATVPPVAPPPPPAPECACPPPAPPAPILVDEIAESEPVRVVEPELSVVVTPDGAAVTPGGEAVFVVEIRNDSDVDAFDVTLDPVQLPHGLSRGDGPWAPPAIERIAAGATVTLTFTATVAADVTPGAALPIDVSVRYTSLPDSHDYGSDYPPGTGPRNLSPFVAASDQERTGADGPQGLNDYWTRDAGGVVPADSRPVPPPVAPPEPGEPGLPPSGREVPPDWPALGVESPPLTPLDAYTFGALFTPDRVPPLDEAGIFPDPPPAVTVAAPPPAGAEVDCVPEPPKPVVVKPRPKPSLLEGGLRPERPAASEAPVPVRKRFVPPPVALPPVNC